MTIVTTTYRRKRAPRKGKAAPLAGPAVVTRHGGAKPDNDNAEAVPKAQIVRAAKSTRRKSGWADDGSPSVPAMRVWLERAKWSGGPVG